MKTLRLVNHAHEVRAVVPVAAGPHEWEVGGVKFSTVLVRDDEMKRPRGVYMIIHTASGQRIGWVQGVMAPKSKPDIALQAVAAVIDNLVARHGAAIVGNRIAQAARDWPIPPMESAT